MSDALDSVMIHQAALVAALDARDLDGVDLAIQDMAEALTMARGGTLAASPALRARLQAALTQADDARGRVNVLADRNRTHLARFARMADADLGNSYTRAGRPR